MREARHRVIDITCLLATDLLRTEARATCVSDLVSALKVDGLVCLSCSGDPEQGIGRAVGSVLECSRGFHCLPPEEKEKYHHDARHGKVGGYFRKGEEPIYNEGELYTLESSETAAAAATTNEAEVENEEESSSRIGVSYVEDFCVHMDLGWSEKAKRTEKKSELIKDDDDDGEKHPSGGAKENQVWPAQPSGFRRRVGEYMQKAVELGHALHGALVEGLHLRSYGFEESPSLVRLLSYPGGAKHGNITSHSDYEVFTLIHQERPGLQVLQDSQWCWAPSTSFTATSLEPLFVMLANDMLEFWTNGEVTATKHRVVNQEREASRYSIVMFYAANEEEDATPLERYHRGNIISESNSSGTGRVMSTRQAVAKGRYCSSYLAACSKAKTKIGSLTQGSHLSQRIAESLSVTRTVLGKLGRGSSQPSKRKRRKVKGR